jgi:hypothetical protein
MKGTLRGGVVVLALLVWSGCAKEAREMAAPASDSATASVSRAEQAPAAPGQPAAGQEGVRPQPSPRKLIRTVDLALVVRDTEAAARRVEALASSLGGFVSDVNAQRSENLLEYQMTLRVPAERLGEALGALRKLAVRVEGERLATEDVTDKYIDLDARMRTLKATEDELRELLAESRERQRKVEDIMSIYRELTEIRAQIEQIQGQLNAFDRLVALSTIRLTLRSDVATAPVVRDEWRPAGTVRGSARVLVEILKGLANVLIFLLIVVLPLVLLIGVPIWLLRRYLKRRQPPGGTPGVG